MEFRKRYVAFLNELSKLAKTHDELTDTDVRERLHEVINYHFVWDKPMKGFPKRFAMMSLRRGSRGCGAHEQEQGRKTQQ